MTVHRSRHLVLATAALVAGAFVPIGLAGPQASGVPRFYDDDPVEREVDSQDASGVRRWEPTLLYDLLENLFARPGDPDRDRGALNVNTVDEVPDGNWFVNRLGTHPLTPDALLRANTSAGPAPGTWTIVSAKSDGVTPGFTVRDANGIIWYLKFDPPGHRGMATGTEVVVARLFWALGYHTAEYHLVDLRRDRLAIDETAEIRPPGTRPRRMRLSDLDWLFARADRHPDGSYRAVASRELAGRFVGRFRFYGTRPDDPNDIVPHEHRRELRGYRVFAAWLNHVDAKSTNTADTVVVENGRAVVRHHLLDFGSALGSAGVAPREYWEGDEYVVEPRSVAARTLGLGLIVPAWRTKPVVETPSVGRLDAELARWDPDRWKPRVPNAAFLRARPDDTFWAARKLAAVTDDHIRAAVAAGAFGDPPAETLLVRTLAARRDAILRRYLPAVNPIVDPRLDTSGVLTFRNAAVEAGAAPAPGGYTAAWFLFDNATGHATPLGETGSSTPRLPAPAALPSTRGAFVKVAVAADAPPVAAWAETIDLYFRQSAGAWRLVGLVRHP